MDTNLRKLDVRDIAPSTKHSNPVGDTMMLKGEAQNSLTGKNVTKPDQRAGVDKGKTGGLPQH